MLRACDLELLDPSLPPLLIECLPDGLLVATATSRLQADHLDAMATATERLTTLLLDDHAAVTRLG